MPSFDGLKSKTIQARELLESIGHEVSHSLHVTKLSMALFDQLTSLHELGIEERTLLESAAFLHDIGWSISRKSHHKHSMRIILNSNLPAFDDRELRMLANIVRYHRRSLPKHSHSLFVLLSPEDQLVVRKLASFLRIADGLDTGHETRIRDIECIQANGAYTFKADSDFPCVEELNAVDRKKSLFLETFGKDFRLVFQEINTPIVYFEAAE